MYCVKFFGAYPVEHCYLFNGLTENRIFFLWIVMIWFWLILSFPRCLSYTMSTKKLTYTCHNQILRVKKKTRIRRFMNTGPIIHLRLIHETESQCPNQSNYRTKILKHQSVEIMPRCSVCILINKRKSELKRFLRDGYKVWVVILSVVLPPTYAKIRHLFILFTSMPTDGSQNNWNSSKYIRCGLA